MKRSLVVVLCAVLAVSCSLVFCSCDEDGDETTLPEEEITVADSSYADGTGTNTPEGTGASGNTENTSDNTTETTAEVTTEETTAEETLPQQTADGRTIIYSADQLAAYGVELNFVSFAGKEYIEVITNDDGKIEKTYISSSALTFDGDDILSTPWINALISEQKSAIHASILKPYENREKVETTDKNGNQIELSTTDNYAQYINDSNGVLKSIVTLPPTGNIHTYNAMQSDKYKLYNLELNPEDAKTPFSWDDLDATPFDIYSFIKNDETALDFLLYQLSLKLGGDCQQHITIYKNDVPSYEYLFNNKSFICYKYDNNGNKIFEVAHLSPSRDVQGGTYYLENDKIVKSTKPIIELDQLYKDTLITYYYKLINLALSNTNYADCSIIQNPTDHPEFGRGDAIITIQTPDKTIYMNNGGTEHTPHNVTKIIEQNGDSYTIISRDIERQDLYNNFKNCYNYYNQPQNE